MADTAVDPRDKMRSRDVNRVAGGQQSPRPAHLPGEVSDAPPIETVDDMMEVGTAPADFRFPFTNQTRHCYARYLEYHQCRKVKGEEAPECHKFQRHYRSLCPTEWVVAWNEQRKKGIFPGPL